MTNKRKCDDCGERTASVKLTKLRKGEVEEKWLCPQCAAQASPYQKPLGSIEALISNLLKQTSSGEAAARVKAPAVDISCPTCGLPFESYRASLILGCSDCYEAFGKHLAADLRRFHGSIVHRGRGAAPPAAVAGHMAVDELRRRLKAAVEAEDFELAARLRDEIRAADAESLHAAGTQ